eukprot:1817467-Prymnesium_polylepis.1
MRLAVCNRCACVYSGTTGRGTRTGHASGTRNMCVLRVDGTWHTRTGHASGTRNRHGGATCG